MVDPKQNNFFMESDVPAGDGPEVEPKGSKLATKAIGIFYAILSLMGLSLIAYFKLSPDDKSSHRNTIGPPNDEHVLLLLMDIGLIILILQCTFSIMIVFGAAMNKPRLLFPWLLFNYIMLVAYTILCFGVFGYGFYAFYLEDNGENIPRIFKSFLFYIFSIVSAVLYMQIYPVNKLYRHLKRINLIKTPAVDGI